MAGAAFWNPASVGGSIRVEDEGVSTVAAATALNFAGAGVTVTDAGSNEALVTIPGGGGALVDFARATRSAGNITINGTAWANVDTGTDLVLSATAGDVIEVSPSARLAAGAANTDTHFDVATIVGGSPVNYFATAGGATDEGVLGWRCKDVVDTIFGCAVTRTLVSGDISAGTVTLRLRVRQATAGNRAFVAGTVNPFSWHAKNYGAV